MTIAAKVASAEVDAQVRLRFENKYLEGTLIDAPGVNYSPGVTNDTTFLSNKVTEGTAGYYPQVIGYTPGDFANYSDGGVGLQQKATVFTHNGGGTVLDFTHIALLWSTGNVTALSAASGVPTSMTNGTYTAIPTTTAGSGTGLTVDLTVANGGAVAGDYTLTINNPGRNYAASDLMTIPNGTLAGLDPSIGTGDLTFTISTVDTNADAGDIVAVAKTVNAVSLTAGNQAVFYWNLKHFGFYS